MPRVTKAFPHMTEEELRTRLKEAKTWRTQQKLLVVLNATVDPRPAKEIALHVGVAEQTVRNWMSKYNRFGLEALMGPGRGGRRKALMSKEQEADFLAPFFEQARIGQIPTVAQIGEAIEARVGRPIHETSVSRFLKRNQWRRVMPRPFHPKSDAQVQEDYKKNSRKR